MKIRRYGLIGYPLGHSFSRQYFTEKFAAGGLHNHIYENFELEDIWQLPALLEEHPDLCGLNVTIPHKETVVPYLDWLEDSASRVGAVNTIKISRGRLSGYNTDYYGFRQSLLNWLPGEPATYKALILGSGGAARAVAAVLEELGIVYLIVSRKQQSGQLVYDDLPANKILTHTPLLINTTPLGMYPHTDTYPDIPYHHLTPEHFVYDLVYNPEETLLLQKARERGAATKNGLEMLHLQADRAWEIWSH